MTNFPLVFHAKEFSRPKRLLIKLDSVGCSLDDHIRRHRVVAFGNWFCVCHNSPPVICLFVSSDVYEMPRLMTRTDISSTSGCVAAKSWTAPSTENSTASADPI